MFKKFRNIAPFIMVGYSLLFTIASYFSFYREWFEYLPDLLGYSIFTNILILSLYSNTKFCNATRVAVYGLITLNIFNLIWEATNINGLIYDLFLLITIVLILVTHKFKI